MRKTNAENEGERRKPEYQFRGVFLPAEILILLKSGEVSSAEVILLSIVDGLTPPQSDGCWASNAYLADILGVTPRAVQKSIAILKTKKLLFVTVNGQERRLLTFWSNCTLANERQFVMNKHTHERQFVGHSSLLLRKRDSLDDKVDMRKNQKTSTTSKGVPSFRGVNDDMPAQFRQTQKTESNVTHFDVEAAEKLHAIICDVCGRRGSWSKKRWSEKISRLRRELTSNSEARISKAISWYESNHQLPNCPTITSADSFVKVFSWLEDLEKKKGSVVPITKEAELIADRLLSKTWPKVTRDDILQCVQSSLLGYADFLTLLRIFLKQCNQRLPLSRFVKILHDELPSPASFVENWLLRVHKSVKNWQAWNGDLSALRFTQDAKQFQAEVNSIATLNGFDSLIIFKFWDYVNET